MHLLRDFKESDYLIQMMSEHTGDLDIGLIYGGDQHAKS